MGRTSKLAIPFKEGTKEYSREWRKLNKDKELIYRERYRESSREGAWRRRYGITRLDYEFLFKFQGGVCAICKSDIIGRNHKYFHIDHNHQTGQVRGLLCDLCNRGLGYLKDDSGVMLKAIEYLKGHNENS